MADGERKPRAETAQVELTRDEFSFLIVHVETQLGELRNALGGLEEEEGDSPVKWNVSRSLKKQVELLQDLALKMQGVAKDAGWR